jgi:hypothetical protein
MARRPKNTRSVATIQTPAADVTDYVSRQRRAARLDDEYADAVSHAQERDPYIEFFTRHKDTLAEVITPSELQILNSALRSLFASLREIRPLYQNADAEDRRRAICVALIFYCRFIQLFRKPLEERLDVPILHLIDALAGLNDNLVLPILQSIPKEGRSKSSGVHNALKGLVAATVTYLCENRFRTADAHKALAQWLNTLGVRSERGSGDITPNTVRNWCAEVSSLGKTSTATAAIMCNKMLAESERKRLATAAKKATPEYAARNRFILWVDTHCQALKKI